MALKWLFSSSADKKPEDMNFEEARPAFFKAIKNEDLDVLTTFAKKFPDALGWENDQGTPLFIAQRNKKLSAFKHLIGLGADLQGNAGDLMENAALSGKKDFVQYMLEQGAVDMASAEYYARARKHFDIADMIKRKDIIRAEYLAQNPPPAAQTPALPPAADMATDAKIGVLSPVQLKKTGEAPSA